MPAFSSNRLPRAGLPLLLGSVAAWQALRLRRALRQGRRIAARAQAFEQRPGHAQARVLVVGDSTGLGVGAATPHDTLAGLLAQDFPRAQVTNACRVGARLADLPRQAEAARHDAAEPPHDVVLVLAGGNDVLAPAPLAALRRRADAMLRRLRGAGRTLIWLGPANLGRAPPFIPPLSWWLARRTRRACRAYAAVAAQHGVPYLDFCFEADADPFSADPRRYFAADEVHPSSAGYRWCYAVLRRHAALREALRPPAGAPP